MLADYIKVLLTGSILAQAGAADYVTSLLNVGVAGAMLLWFMLKSEPRMKSMEDTQRATAREIQDNQHKLARETQEMLDLVARSNIMLVIATGLKPLQDQANLLEGALDHKKQERKDDDRIREEKK